MCVVVADSLVRVVAAQYRAPEMCDVRRGERIDERVDIWACGVLLYKVCTLAQSCPCRHPSPGLILTLPSS